MILLKWLHFNLAQSTTSQSLHVTWQDATSLVTCIQCKQLQYLQEAVSMACKITELWWQSYIAWYSAYLPITMRTPQLSFTYMYLLLLVLDPGRGAVGHFSIWTTHCCGSTGNTHTVKNIVWPSHHSSVLTPSCDLSHHYFSVTFTLTPAHCCSHHFC